MILDTLAQLPRYTPVHPLLAKVQAFTETENWDDWGDGRHELIANQVFVILAHDQGRGPVTRHPLPGLPALHDMGGLRVIIEPDGKRYNVATLAG